MARHRGHGNHGSHHEQRTDNIESGSCARCGSPERFEPLGMRFGWRLGLDLTILAPRRPGYQPLR